jgi:integrase/recombinase XerD
LSQVRVLVGPLDNQPLTSVSGFFICFTENKKRTLNPIFHTFADLSPTNTMKLKIKAYCKTSKPRTGDGFCPLYIYLRAAGSREVLVATGRHIDPIGFNNQAGIYISRSAKAARINEWIRDQVDQIDRINRKIQDQHRTPTPSQVKDLYLTGGQSVVFYDFAITQLAKEKATLAADSWADYKLRLDQLEVYAPGINFHQITVQFLEEYQNYLLHVKNRRINGIYHDLATIRKFVNIADRRHIIDENPFATFRIRKDRQRHNNFLTAAELHQLHQLHQAATLAPHLQRTLYWFLWACCAGYRLRDVQLLSVRLMIPDQCRQILADGSITIATSKSRFKKSVTLDLYNRLEYLLSCPPAKPMKSSKSSINKDLKIIISIAGIRKAITFHSGRHTMGVVAKQAGIDTAVIQDILGHESIQTTEIYQHMVEDLKKNEINKLNLI